MSAFPTFRLPFVAAKAVINRMDLGDLTALFLCSKKTRKFIKSLHKEVSFDALSFEQKENLNVLEIIELFHEDKQTAKLIEEYVEDINIEISNNIGFRIYGNFYHPDEEDSFDVYTDCIDQQDEYQGTRSNLRIGDIEIPVVMTKKDEIYTFWNDKQEGFKTIGEYLGEKITPEIYRLIVNGVRKQEYSENLKFVINWMNSTNRIPQNCSIGEDTDDKINEEDVKFILDNIHPTEEYDVSAKLSEEFQYDSNIKSKELCLLHANWFTLENLFKTECKNIRLYESKLTNDDLNKYLEQWMEGKFQNLEELNVERGYGNRKEDMESKRIWKSIKFSIIWKIQTRILLTSHGKIMKFIFYGMIAAM